MLDDGKKGIYGIMGLRSRDYMYVYIYVYISCHMYRKLIESRVCRHSTAAVQELKGYP